MSTALLCLLGFAAWTALLPIVLITYRSTKLLTGRASTDDFRADVPHGGERYRRLMRAHANCVENLPLFAAVVLVAASARLDPPHFALLAQTYLGARVVQSIIHIASGSALAVYLRFTAFFVQLVCLGAMGLAAARALGAWTS